MSENYNIDIISPEEVILSDKVNSVTIPSFEGEMTILSDHIPVSYTHLTLPTKRIV